MGAPKLKWTSEEEEALRAGIAKHGTGKWKTIIKDPEFSAILSSRSNVDLKDKWRNINVFSTHGGSREKAREAVKRNQPQQQIIVKQEEKPLVVIENNYDQMMVVYEEKPFIVAQALQSIEQDAIDAKPLLLLPSVPSKKKITRLDNLVLEAITSLKEPRGSNKTNISMYIEDQYDALPDFKRVLSEKLKSLTASGKVIKVNHKYRIAPPCATFSQVRSSAEPLPKGRQTDSSRTEKVQMEPLGRQTDSSRTEKMQMEPLGRQTDSYRTEKAQMRFLSQSQVDAELEKMRCMTAQEAASAAARAVAEAEAALAEAEQAEIDAQAAEADAEEAQAFAEAALMTLKSLNTHNTMVYA